MAQEHLTETISAVTPAALQSPSSVTPAPLQSPSSVTPAALQSTEQMRTSILVCLSHKISVIILFM